MQLILQVDCCCERENELLSVLIWRNVLTVQSLMRYSICKSQSYFSLYSVGTPEYNLLCIHLSAAEGYHPCSVLRQLICCYGYVMSMRHYFYLYQPLGDVFLKPISVCCLPVGLNHLHYCLQSVLIISRNNKDFTPILATVYCTTLQAQ